MNHILTVAFWCSLRWTSFFAAKLFMALTRYAWSCVNENKVLGFPLSRFLIFSFFTRLLASRRRSCWLMFAIVVFNFSASCSGLAFSLERSLRMFHFCSVNIDSISLVVLSFYY